MCQFMGWLHADPASYNVTVSRLHFLHLLVTWWDLWGTYSSQVSIYSSSNKDNVQRQCTVAISEESVWSSVRGQMYISWSYFWGWVDFCLAVCLEDSLVVCLDDSLVVCLNDSLAVWWDDSLAVWWDDSLAVCWDDSLAVCLDDSLAICWNDSLAICMKLGWRIT